MEKNNLNLVEHCKKALREKWYYGWGAHGQKATKTLVDSLVKQYPSMNTRWGNYMTKAVQTKNNLCDCYGLVKGFLYTDSTGKMKYNPKLDVNTGGAYNRAIEKGPLSSLPELPGVILYMSGHVGVYIGNGEFIECMGGGEGMFKGKIENGKVTKGSKFTHWFKDVSIVYVDKVDIQQSRVVEEEVVEEATEENNGLVSMIVGNKTEYVKGFVVEDYNYVNLREIAEILGYAVEYDPFMKVPILGEKIRKIDDEYLKEVAIKLGYALEYDADNKIQSFSKKSK